MFKFLHGFFSFSAHTREAGRWALRLLNELESGDPTISPQSDIEVYYNIKPSFMGRWHDAAYYRSHRNDGPFRESMTAAVRKWNAESKMDDNRSGEQPAALGAG
jgi:hypothetical protein